MKTKVLLAPSFELALTIEADATVEAEYGSNVVEGKVCTLAHHVEAYRHCPAPCNNSDIPVLADGSTILISHFDLDTLGGVLALLGKKPVDDDFWYAAEYVDCNGPHYAHRFPDQEPKLNAYWAFNHTQHSSWPVQEITDVTSKVLMYVEIVERILSGDNYLLSEGTNWAKETFEKVEGCLVEETEQVRVFVTDDVFCSAAYYSKRMGIVVPVTVAMNTKSGSITVATCDDSINARDVVQSLWGSEAGGHPGIAGSPRGRKMGLTDLVNAVSGVTTKA